MSYIIETALELGTIYCLVSLGLFLSFRVLNIADLTTDGCFVLGATVSVSLAAAGHPAAGIFMGMIAGGCAGWVTAFLHTCFGIPDILAGIITNTGLYTVNLMVMGWRSNIALLREDTVFTLFRRLGLPESDLLLAGLIAGSAMVLMGLFLKTRLGLSVRATGDNRAMVSASSVSVRASVMVGLTYANMMTGLAGAMAGQFQKVADINSGNSIVVVALACLIIGETVLGGRKSSFRSIAAVLAGNIIYRFIYASILASGVIPVECLKLMTALIVAAAIAAPAVKKNIALRRRMYGQEK